MYVRHVTFLPLRPLYGVFFNVYIVLTNKARKGTLHAEEGMLMNLLIDGNGQMATLFLKECRERKVDHLHFMTEDEGETLVIPQHLTQHDGKSNIAIHMGKGRRLKQLVEFCSASGTPLIQFSTHAECQGIGSDGKFIMVHAPQTALLILATIMGMGDLARSMDGLGLTRKTFVAETHQITKKSLPGTAAQMAEAVGIPRSEIASIRDVATQLSLGVPTSSLDGHGHHFVHFVSDDVHVRISTHVNGRMAYVKGVLFLANALLLLNGAGKLQKNDYTALQIATHFGDSWSLRR